MAKISGFFMSTLLIILCLWINVCHYPDAADASRPAVESAPPVEDVPESVSPASEPVENAPTEPDEPTEPTPNRQGGLLADVGAVPELLDVSATLPKATPNGVPAATLAPASFPVDGAEIDDALAEPQDAASTPSNSTLPASQTASPVVATPTQDARRLATKPRGAKYVRVPEVEIDAFSGGVRAARSSGDETRVVGATRAQATRVVAPAP